MASLVSAARAARALARASKEEEKEEEEEAFPSFSLPPRPPSPLSISASSSSGFAKRIAEAPTSASDAAIALSGSAWCSGTAHPPLAQTPHSAAAKPGEGRPSTATLGPLALAPVSGSTFLFFRSCSEKSTRSLRASAVARAVSASPEKVVTRPVRESTRAGAEGPCARESAAASVGRRGGERGRGGRGENADADAADEKNGLFLQSASRLAATPAQSDDSLDAISFAFSRLWG